MRTIATITASIAVVAVAALVVHLVGAVQSAHQESNRMALAVIQAQQQTILELARAQRGPNVAAALLVILIVGGAGAALWLSYRRQELERRRLEIALRQYDQLSIQQARQLSAGNTALYQIEKRKEYHDIAF